MDTAEFIEVTTAILPRASHDAPPAPVGDELYAFSFVSRALVPGYLEALDRSTSGELEAIDRVRLLSELIELAFVEGDDDLVDALAMRVVERHLCRDSVRARIAWKYLGESTRGVVAKFRALVESADRNVAKTRDADLGGPGPRGTDASNMWP